MYIIFFNKFNEKNSIFIFVLKHLWRHGAHATDANVMVIQSFRTPGWEPFHRVDVSDYPGCGGADVGHEPHGCRLQPQEALPQVLPLGLHEDSRQRGGERSRGPASWQVRIYRIFLKNKTHQIPRLQWFSSRPVVVSAQYIEARCSVENEDVVGAAPTGDAPTTSEWSTILLPTKVRVILQVWR